MNRRTLLKAMGAGAVGLGLGLPGLARAAWGDVGAGIWPSGVSPATSLLEIYLWGGMAPWESFYFRPGVGGTTRGFDADVGALTWNSACSGTPVGLETQALATDSTGAPVSLGPFAKPLWRSDIRSRMRVVVMRHDLAPHEAAIPYALSGRRLGRPDATGLGAPIQRRARALDTLDAHPLPFSYCLIPEAAVGSPFFNTMDAVGSHGGNAKPTVLPIGASTASFISNLTRTVPAGADGVLAHYAALYGNRLKRGGVEVRSAAYRDYASSVAGLESAPALASLLTGAPLTIGPAPFCSRDTATFGAGQHFTGAALRAAAYLLNHPDLAKRASYVGVVDGGPLNDGFAYDVHHAGATPGQAQRTSSTLWETLSALGEIIRAPGAPPDPLKIDLATTLVVIKTEFGRTPYRSLGDQPNASSTGRDHWPQGYAQVFIGGPIPAPGVAGAISDGTGNTGQGEAIADHFYAPQDVQAAALLGVGIDPFADGNLPVGDLSPSVQDTLHTNAMIKLRQQLLGVA